MNMFALSDADIGGESDARILILVPSAPNKKLRSILIQ